MLIGTRTQIDGDQQMYRNSVNTALWLDLAVEAVTTVNVALLNNINVTAVEI
jgi:hypothetical protein